MRVLWVTGNHPAPNSTGGAVHEFELLRGLARSHEIHVISADQRFDMANSPLPDIGVTVERVTYPQPRHPTNRVGVALAMLQATPTLLIWLMRHRIGPLREAIGRGLASDDVDLVHVTHGDFAPVLSAAPGPTSLLLFDSYTRQAERAFEGETITRRRLQRAVELRRTRRYERRWYSGVAGLAAVSSVDAAFTEKLTGRRVDVLPNPIGPELFEPPAVSREQDTVAFVGTIGYPPNYDAILWLIEEIWPMVLSEIPTAKLLIAGRGPDDPSTVPGFVSRLEALGGTCEINVADIRTCYWRAAAVVAPMRLGSGLRNKVIHAMACGAPVVATPTAVEGVPVRHNESVLLGESATEVALQIIATLRDRESAATRAAAAAEVARAFDADVLLERFDCWWNTAARR